MTKWTSLVILGVSSLLWGTDKLERPAAPTPGVDTELITGGDPRKFFEDRRKSASSDCAKDLEQSKKDYASAVQKLKDLRAAKASDDAIDKQGAEVLSLRAAMTKKVGECGECAIRHVVPEDYSAVTRKVTWYVSHGSCQIPSTDPAVLSKAFDLITDSLLHAKRYPKYKGGFDNILDLQIVKPSGMDFVFESGTDAFPASPLNLAIWVRGPKVPFMTIPFGFRYYMDATYETKKSLSGFREFVLNFDTLKTGKVTNRVNFPDVTDFTPSGKKIEVKAVNLYNVMGQWYITEDGYIRYFTAAEFPVKMKDIETLGESILTDTLAELSNRGQWE